MNDSMIKKYGLIWLNYIVMLCVIIFYTNEFSYSSQANLLPVLSYVHSQETLVTLWSESSLKALYPNLEVESPREIIARREDEFVLNKLKPVELMTMMGLENAVDTIGNVIENEGEMEMHQPSSEVTDSKMEIAETGQVDVAEEALQAVFVPHTLQNKVDMAALKDYETLLKNFYTIDTCAMVGSNLLDAEALEDVDLRITKNLQEPQILIYHTHSQEAFADSVQGDDSTTIVGVGEHLAQILREEYGYQVIHHLGKYDEETRNNAYSRALPDVAQLLQDYPSIEVVIDLHRDAVDENTRLVTDIDGRPTARFMFFNGVSCTKNTGSISYLENEYQKENLAFSFQMKKAAEEYYPGLTRKNYIHGYRYNMHLLPRTTLIELGAQNNTLEEAMNACYPIAHILDMVLTGA